MKLAKLRRQQKHGARCADLPQGVKLLAVWDGELAGLVLVNAIMHHLSFMQQTQSVRSILISLTNPAEGNKDV